VGIISVEIVLVPFLSTNLSFPSRHNFRENDSGAISYQCLYVSRVGIFSVEIVLVPFLIDDSKFPQYAYFLWK